MQYFHKPEDHVKLLRLTDIQALPPQLAASMTKAKTATTTTAIFLGSILLSKYSDLFTGNKNKDKKKCVSLLQNCLKTLNE